MKKILQCMLILGLIESLASCRASQRDASRRPSELAPRPSHNKGSLQLIAAIPKISKKHLNSGTISVSPFQLAGLSVASIALKDEPEVADYFEYSACLLDAKHKNQDESCTFGRHPKPSFLLTNLSPGKYKIKVRSCVSKLRVIDEPCGSYLESLYLQSQNADLQSRRLLLELESIQNLVKSISNDLYQRLSIYQKEIESNAIPWKQDNLHNSIKNILEIGPERNSIYFLSPDFSEIKLAVLAEKNSRQAEKKSLNLLNTNQDGRSYSYEDNWGHKRNPLSTFGTVMLIGGGAAVTFGFMRLPILEGPNEMQKLETYKASIMAPGSVTDAKKLEKLELDVARVKQRGGLSAINSAKWRLGIKSVAGGLLAILLGTQLGLAADSEHELKQKQLETSLMKDLNLMEERMDNLVARREVIYRTLNIEY